ncbi:PREDICTED: uncharacterized protein LOC109239742 [Nicotiana attenuata]|uniref:uncharacterized protein LOC109239742 n=1 Tax=Nicotiana attenuata TaxID=49451 RepID=UPI00090584E4|nr:PREDICTED: uncharacterized protein LOC109239742 [Nicotiana attenuata]
MSLTLAFAFLAPAWAVTNLSAISSNISIERAGSYEYQVSAPPVRVLPNFFSSGYDRFDRKEGIVCIFRWGFPGKNRRIFLRFLIKDIQSVRIEVKEGIYARRVLYMDIRGQGSIPLTRTDENLTPREIEQKAAELAYFLRVPIEVF